MHGTPQLYHGLNFEIPGNYFFGELLVGWLADSD
jgi:hypothetical protein